MRRITYSISVVVLFLISFAFTPSALPWNNGQAGNAATDDPSECSNPPYSGHDWIADHALALLPDNEKAWIIPHKTLYLLGTEAPDNKKIPNECNGPDTGYDDRRLGHSVEWNSNHTEMINDRAAKRAQEEYDKAALAFQQGNPSAAAFYLGAMAHYIGDVSQYGHSNSFKEKHHSDYEGWVGRRTKTFSDGTFESYMQLDSLVRRRAFTAVKRISKVTSEGNGKILSAQAMDDHYSNKDQEYLDSIGESLNLGVNELADVLHTFFLNVVSEQ